MSHRHLCGWVQDPRAVDAVLATLPLPLFGDAAPHLAGTGDNKDVCFWDAEQKLLGRVLRSTHQRIGSCVGHGWARACQDLMLVEIAAGEAEQLPPGLDLSDSGVNGFVSTEAIYGGSRCEVGNQWGSRNDGSVGAWAARWVTRWGALFRKDYGPGLDLTRHDTPREKEWGARGVPDALEPVAREHPVGTVSQVRSYEQARDALCNGYPVPVASSQGFTERRRAGGWCDPQGTWMHQMTARGHVVTKGNKPAVVIGNSWGGYLGTANATVQLEGGREIVLPEGCFLCAPEVFDRMARQGDTFAVSQFRGFPRRDINWFV